KYARFSGAAYKINSLNWNCGSICTNADTQGTNVVYHWNKGGVKPSFGYVALKSNTKEIIVAYRGSETAMDWVTDARVVQKAWPSAVKNSHVHSGFLDAYSSDAANIKKAVLGLVNSNPTFTIVITGHSLGGAEATLAAADFSLSYPDWKSKIALYTYGSPRAGNPEFASWVSSQPFPIFRVTYKGDPVPRIPLRSENFRHVTQEVYYPKSGGLKFCGDVAESNKCID
ncbi:alpha/beta-hydrolase, partial [Martensiomyces pterosporus]